MIVALTSDTVDRRVSLSLSPSLTLY